MMLKKNEGRNEIFELNKIIEEQKKYIKELETINEELNLGINVLKTEKSKSTEFKEKNKKIWLTGYYGERDN
jgi:methionine salvage enolase-phosphatase E1